LPSAKQKALGKEDGVGYRYPRAPLCRVPNFAECLALGKVWLCRVPYFAECQTLGKALFAECQVSPSAALGKGGLCRVPDIWHSAKI